MFLQLLALMLFGGADMKRRNANKYIILSSMCSPKEDEPVQQSKMTEDECRYTNNSRNGRLRR
jgi:hypothetical protein